MLLGEPLESRYALSATPWVSLDINEPAMRENASGGLVCTFTRSEQSDKPLWIAFEISGNADWSDYDISSNYLDKYHRTGLIQIHGRSQSTTLTINPWPDSIVEPDEQVIIRLAMNYDRETGQGLYFIGTPESVVGTILNDDVPTVTLSTPPTAVAEDSGNALTFTFTRSEPFPSDLFVSYTVSGTATVGVDYTGLPSGTGTRTVRIPADVGSATVTVVPVRDTTVEPDETVVVSLVSGTGYRISQLTAVTGTIENDGEFSDNKVTRLDKVVMRYNHDKDTGLSVAEMLAHPTGKGQCTAWAELLVSTLGVHGVLARTSNITAAPNFGVFDVRAVAAQGSGGNPYRTTSFGFHQVVRVDGQENRIYDPSYGTFVDGDLTRRVELVYEDRNIVRMGFYNELGQPEWVTKDTKGQLELTYQR